MTTKGCRALLERRVGISTVSGSIAVRGLRGVMCFGLFELIGAALIPFTSRSESVGYGSAAPGTALPVSLEYGTDPRADPRSPSAGRNQAVRPAGAGVGVGAPLKRRVERPQAGHCRSAAVRIRSPPHIPFCSMHDQ
jgi:hypothetical protein